MAQFRYILRRIDNQKVLCRPKQVDAPVCWESQQLADQWGITIDFASVKGASNALKNYGPKGIEIVVQELSEDLPTISERITEYLSAGGLINPELMDHTAVRDILIDARDELGEGPLPPEEFHFFDELMEEQYLP